MKKTVFYGLIILILTAASCKKGNPVVTPVADQPQASLTLEDASCTEAWIKLNTENLSLPADAELYKDSSLAGTINLITEDTVLYVDSLLPNQTYNFHTIIHPYNHTSQLTSSQLPVTTMDTTSHNFTWQTWTFGGQAGSCALYDVTIINENDIWAVGEIYLLDTLGQPDPNRYNLVKWDGNSWEIRRVPYYYQGQPYYNPIQSVIAFGPEDIWFCGNGVIHWDGDQYNPVPIPTNIWGPYQMNKLWGTSDNDLYAVGYNGSIVHYDGQNWSRIESGTELNINDIWGYTDNLGNKLILCAASDLGTNHQKKLLRINNNSVDTISWSPQKTLYTVWFNSTYKIYAGGGKTYASCGNDWVEQTPVNYFNYKMRGNAWNDIFAVGNSFAHFNGYTWRKIPELNLAGETYESLATKGNITCAVGYIGAKAVITIVQR